MQTKPDSNYTIYLCFDGITLTGPAPFGFPPGLFGGAWSWVQYVNLVDIDGTYIGFNISNYLNTLSFPPATNEAQNQRNEIINRVKKYFEIFDVNITDERPVFDNTPAENRHMAIITQRPTAEEFNSLLNDKTEESYFSYSYRRFLLGVDPRTNNDLPGMIDIMLQNPTYIRMATWSIFGFTAPDSYHYQKTFGFGDVSFNWPSIVFSDNFNFKSSVYISLHTSEENRRLEYRGFTRDVPPDTAETISKTIAHELGHQFPFKGHRDNSGHDGNLNGDFANGDYDYYFGHNNWGPIMGNPKVGTQLIQWSKGEYNNATNKVDDDISLINKDLPLIKKPKKSMSPLSYTQKDSIHFESKYWDKSLGYNVRILTKNDVEEIKENGRTQKIIKGLIGFPYDFDIIKMVLPPGTYTFTINPFFEENQATMLDPKLEILNCHCQESKEDNNPACNQNDLPSFYPSDINQNKMQCICFNDNIEYGQSISSPENDGFYTVSVTSTLKNRGIIYLRIKGDKNRTPSDGWSRYGSLGEYYLKIKRSHEGAFSNDPSTFLSNNILPKVRCEDFNTCAGQILLYTEDETGGPIGNPNEEHFIELNIVKNGQKEIKKFLVYGQPLSMDTLDRNGKFYLPVIIDGECKKQEFITGGEWEL